MFKSVQQLRGIAVLAVVFFHASMATNTFDIFSKGNVGVQLFFMISGFIMALVHGKDVGITAAGKFFKKRAIRIYPLYFVVFFIVASLFWLTGKGGEHFYDITNIIKNIFIINEPSLRIHPYQWTLVFEVFYYLTFGLISIGFGLGVVKYCFLMFVFYLVSTHLGGDNLFGNFNNIYFIVGCLIGRFFKQTNIDLNSIVIILPGVLFFSYPLFFENKLWLLLLASVFFIVIINSNKTIPSLEKIGDASYSIYLSHAIIMTVGSVIIPDYYGMKFIILVSLSLLVGFLFFYYIEKPLTFVMKNKYMNKQYA